MSSWPLPHYRKCNDRVREALAAGFHPRKSESAKVSFLSVGLLHCMSRLVALFANSLRCNGASAVEGRPAVIGVTA
jgi:hypothetical protein